MYIVIYTCRYQMLVKMVTQSENINDVIMI